MDSPLVSIVIPAYNASRFLGCAVESVLRQKDFNDWELIIVDDGSTDDTPALARRYAEADRRVRFISKPNGGQSTARNAGLLLAQGKYLCFIDADDLISPDFLRSTVDEAEASGADIVITKVREQRLEATELSEELSGYLFPTPRAKALRIDPFELTRHTLYQTPLPGTGYFVPNDVVACIYRRSLWEQAALDSPARAKGVELPAPDEPIRLREGTYYEDLDIFYPLWLRAAKISLIPEVKYIYRMHGASYMHVFNKRRLDVLDVTDRMLEWTRMYYPELADAAADRRMSAHFNMLLLMWRHGVDDPAAKERCRRVIRERRAASLRNPRVRLKNRLGALLSYLCL